MSETADRTRGSADGVLVARLDGTVLSAGAAVERWTGRPAGGLVGLSLFSDLFAFPHADHFRKHYLPVIAKGGRVSDIVVGLRHQVGGPVPVSVVAEPTRASSSEEADAIVLRMTNSADERGSEALGIERRRNDLLAAVADSSSDALIGIGPDHTVVSWNRAAEALYGYTSVEIVGKQMAILAGEDRPAEIDRYIDRVLAGESVVLEAVRRRRGGGSVEVAITAAPMRDASGVVFGVSAVHRGIGAVERTTEHLRLVMRELSHRTKNLLAIIQAMARQTARSAPSIEAFHSRFSDRLQSIAISHDLLVQENWVGAGLEALIRAQISFLADAGDRFTAEGPGVLLTPVAAQNLGLVVHELAANASRFGALNDSNGTVAVRWHWEPRPAAADVFVISWVERGGPRVQPPIRQGFGRVVIDQMVARALEADIRLDFDPSGFSWTIVMPASYARPISPLPLPGAAPPSPV